jgi:hypothetical protein
MRFEPLVKTVAVICLALFQKVMRKETYRREFAIDFVDKERKELNCVL